MNLQELYDWIFRQNPDGSSPSLKSVGIIVGALLVVAHLAALVRAEQTMKFAKEFPRNRPWGVALLLVCTVWSLFLVKCMDMGEFFSWRQYVLMLVPVTFVLVVTFVPEFLSVRALGTLMLLAASPVLHAAFLKPQTSRLLLPVLAYAWIIAGMFFVGTPYVLRDWVNWLTQSAGRWKLAALGGAAYGVLMLVAAFASY